MVIETLYKWLELYLEPTECFPTAAYTVVVFTILVHNRQIILWPIILNTTKFDYGEAELQMFLPENVQLVTVSQLVKIYSKGDVLPDSLLVCKFGRQVQCSTGSGKCSHRRFHLDMTLAR